MKPFEQLTHPKRPALVGLVLVGSLVTAAIAYASIPDANGVIHGCYDRHGALRVVDAATGQACRPSETVLTWDQTGPQGPQGAPGSQGPQGTQGPAGPAGPAGAAGVSQVYTTTANNVDLVDGGPADVAALVLPAGSYYVSATGTGGDVSNDTNTQCTLESVDVLTDTTTPIQETDFDTFGILGSLVVSEREADASFALSGVATIGAGTRFEVDCFSDDASSDGTPEINHLTISALQVGAVN